MISDCDSEVERLTEGLAELREALKRIEATLKSTEDAHAAETSQLEFQVSGLERDLGKSASALFRMRKKPRLPKSVIFSAKSRVKRNRGLVSQRGPLSRGPVSCPPNEDGCSL